MRRRNKSSFRVIVAEHCRSIYVPLMIKRRKIQVRIKTSCFATPPHRIYSSPFKGNRFVPLHCTPSSPSNPIKMTLIRHSSFSAHCQGDSETGRSQGQVYVAGDHPTSIADDDEFIVWRRGGIVAKRVVSLSSSVGGLKHFSEWFQRRNI